MARISRAELEEERKSSPTLDYMIKNGIKLTRANYLSIAYLGDVPNPLGVEEEAAIPEFLQNWKVRHAE